MDLAWLEQIWTHIETSSSITPIPVYYITLLLLSSSILQSLMEIALRHVSTIHHARSRMFPSTDRRGTQPKEFPERYNLSRDS